MNVAPTADYPSPSNQFILVNITWSKIEIKTNEFALAIIYKFWF